MGWTKSRRARHRWPPARTHTAEVAPLAHHFRPRLEALEDRIQLGDTLLGLTVVALGEFGFALQDTPLVLAPSETEHREQDSLLSKSEWLFWLP